MDNVDVVRKTFEAFNAGGVEAALPYFDPAIEWYGPPEWLEQHLYEGYDGLRKLAADWGENFNEYRLDLGETFDLGGDRLIVLGWQRGLIKVAADPVEQQIGYDWRMRDGKTVWVQAFFAWNDALEAGGLKASA